jgi:hypothetical protein
MQNVMWFAGGALLAAGIAIGTGAQDEPKKKTGMEGDHAMQAPKPTPEHEWLAKGAGTWKANVTKTMPDGTTLTSTGKETVRKACGGLWVVCEFTEDKATAKGPMGPYECLGFTGYDPDHRKFVGSGCSSMVYAPVKCEGSLDAEKKVLTMNCTGYCPIRKTAVNFKEVLTVVDDNHRTFVITEPGTEGKDMQLVKIDYVRE